MRLFALPALLALLALLALGASAAPPGRTPTRLENLEAIPLHAGVNPVRDFAGDGRDALIVTGWRDNGNAHGFDVFIVLLPATRGGSDYNVVTFASEHDATSIADAPHTGEDFVRSVRFARAVIDGRRETLALIATRTVTESYPAPARALIQILVLRNRGDDPAGPLDSFEERARWETSRRYCNSDSALRAELGVPVRAGWGTPNTPDGCVR